MGLRRGWRGVERPRGAALGDAAAHAGSGCRRWGRAGVQGRAGLLRVEPASGGPSHRWRGEMRAGHTGKTEWVAHITIAHETYGPSEAVK